MDTVASVTVSLPIKALTTGKGQGPELRNYFVLFFFFQREVCVCVCVCGKHYVTYTKMYHYAKPKNSISD